MPTTRDRLLDLLAARTDLTQGDLAGRLGVSTRQARRHLAALVDEGAVVAEPDGTALRYRLSDGATPATSLPDLTEAEMEALSVAALAARPLLAPTPLAGPLATAAAKIERAALQDVLLFEAETDAARWSFDGAAGPVTAGADAVAFRALLDAARGGHAVSADYYTASRRALGRGRTLAPLGMVVRGGAWLVACRDLDADGAPVKDFALAGFRSVAPLPGRFVDPPDGWSLAAAVAGRFGALDGDVVEVRLAVAPEAVAYFARKEYGDGQRVEPLADGGAEVTFRAAGLDAVRAWVLSWGPRVRVLAPEPLAAAVAADLRAAASGYGDE